jgi:hypothetical protein
MGISDILVQTTAQANQNLPQSDIAGNLQKGAQLAMHAEELSQQRAQLEQKRVQIKTEQAGLFWERFQKITSISGMTPEQKTNAGRGLRDSVGLSNMISDDVLQLAAKDPVTKSKMAKATSDLKNGTITKKPQRPKTLALGLKRRRPH